LSWTKALRISGRIVASSLAICTASAALAGTIVIRSSGPSAKTYPTGKSIPDGQKLALKAGDTLVLLDAKGTRTLNGAGNFSTGATARGAAAPSAFAALIGNAGGRQVRTGAVRGTGSAQPRVASLWYVDTSKSGTVCLKDMTRATLWRASMTSPVMMTLSYGSKSVPLAFAAGQAVRAWPVADLPLAFGEEYRISGPGLAAPTVIRIAAFTSASTAPDDVASTLIGKGCTVQLDALVEAGKVTPSVG
jgi:hypothetical protein